MPFDDKILSEVDEHEGIMYGLKMLPPDLTICRYSASLLVSQ